MPSQGGMAGRLHLNDSSSKLRTSAADPKESFRKTLGMQGRANLRGLLL